MYMGIYIYARREEHPRELDGARHAARETQHSRWVLPSGIPLLMGTGLKADIEAGGQESLLQTHVLSDGRLPTPMLAIGNGLSIRAKWAFLLTNIPYAFAAFWIGCATSIPTAEAACFGELCASAAFHGSCVSAMCLMSTYWHGAQCQMNEWLYCRRADGTAALHSPKWLRRLLLSDVACSLSLVGIGFCCFGAARTLSWIAPSFLAFLVARRAKARRQWSAYAFWHGLWHVASAVSIAQIVLNPNALGPWYLLGMGG